MATIRVCAMDHYGPIDLCASVHHKPIFAPQTNAEVPLLYLYLGADLIEIWPADPEKIRMLGSKLTDLAEKLELDMHGKLPTASTA